jgi:hypothetical protein
VLLVGATLLTRTLQNLRNIPRHEHPPRESITVMSSRLDSGWSDNSSVDVDGKEGRVVSGDLPTVRMNDIGPGYLLFHFQNGFVFAHVLVRL